MRLLPRLIICLLTLAGAAGTLHALVPPHPLYEKVPAGYQPTRIEMPAPDSEAYKLQPKPIPNDILVLRAQFSDLQFRATAAYPDDLPHDTAFFERWMLHLADFFADASHFAYDLDYTVLPQVFTLPQPLEYYGADGDSLDIRLNEFISDLLAQADPVVNFNNYGGVIVFHAGAGQESDITGENAEEIWSTFLTRKRLQGWFDPNNDAYPGLATADGARLANIVIVPESEYQDYFPGEDDPDASAYLFSIYGVLAHQFGHLIGLPTLFDNDSTDGVSQGIGNWGLMGTGVWNGSGYVPAQLDPWCRLYLGWEPCITVTENSEDLAVDFFLDAWPWRNRLYKIPISEQEYFLVENRQQNPDGSLDPYSSQPSYSFKLLPEGEQDYYPDSPLTPEIDESVYPFFNFMENRYVGSEWDFMLPGLGTTSIDGSGILIWHIDENVIAEKFTANFDLNYVNSYAQHKGVDLEEADGTQHLDVGTPDPYKYGGPYDSFRAGNNDYFGNQEHNGVTWLPTAASYYGGIPLEIYDIGSSANQMTFSVSFGWYLSAGYTGVNPLNACCVDFDGDGETELFYPMPDGQLHLWKDELPAPGYPLSRQPVPYNYVWDGDDFYLPMQLGSLARLYRLASSGGEYVANLDGLSWAAQPVALGDKLFMPLNDSNSNHGKLYAFDKQTRQLEQLREFEEPIASNLVYFRDRLYIPCRTSDYSMLWNYNLGNGEFRSKPLPLPADSTLAGIFMAPLIPGGNSGQLILQCPNSLYVLDAELEDLPGFPFLHDLQATAPLTISDWDRNGSLDLILTSDSGLAVIDYSGSRMSPASLYQAASDSLAFSAGALALDINHDGAKELLGNFRYNRLNCWKQDWRSQAGFPVSFAERSRCLPQIGKASDGVVYAWVATDNGKIFRQSLPQANLADLDQGWFCEYGNLLRHASRDDVDLPNQFQSDNLFVKGEVYLYPNPLKSLYGDKLTLNLMTSRDTHFTLKIFDINGTLVYQDKGQAKSYLRNRELIDLPEGKFHSGVYIAVISTDSDSCSLKFAVEK